MSSEPENFTSAQASDPATPGQTLADIAALRPDLRVAVAGNPSAYPGLLEWLGSLGDPTVDAALAAREKTADAEPADQQATAVMPAQQQPPQQPPQQPQPQQQPQQPSYPAGPAPQYGAPQVGAPGPYGPPPGGAGRPPMGYGYQGSPPKKSNKALWIVLIVVGVIIALLVVGAVVVGSLIRNAVDEGSYGSDPALDRLWDRCEDGDWQACDSLYDQAAVVGGEYRRFGDTCGNRRPAGTTQWCVDAFGDSSEPAPEPGSDAGTYGSDPELDALWVACESGDMTACDDLYLESPIGSEYEAFGLSCGERGGTGSCAATEGGDTDSAEPYDYGDDADLDALWDDCEAGDWQACDTLYSESPLGSIYEAYGDTCGDRQPEGTMSWCVDSMG